MTTTPGSPSPPEHIGKPIIFFDGVCGMCNKFVNVILKADHKRQFLFAPLQGETARQLLPPLPTKPEDWSLIYLDEEGVHDQAYASLQIYRRLGGVWWLLSLGRFLPRFVLKPVYRLIARNRYKWFGRQAECRLPTAEEQERFLP
jgi:predicted DCC family thiol-disulfide oxidoreductase YuxK